MGYTFKNSTPSCATEIEAYNMFVSNCYLHKSYTMKQIPFKFGKIAKLQIIFSDPIFKLIAGEKFLQ